VGGTIPLWVPLVVAVLGLIGTAGGAIAGVVITQRRSDARDRAAWKRERERWVREDAARTLDLRREAYIEFYAANKECLRRGRRRKAIDPRNRSFDAELAVLGALEKVCIYGDQLGVIGARHARDLTGVDQVLGARGRCTAR
jgi:hypothetical protein